MRAYELSGGTVGDELDEAVAVLHRPSVSDIAVGLDLADHIDARGFCLRIGHADAGHLRTGEHGCRDETMVGTFRTVGVKEVVGHDLRFVVGNVFEHVGRAADGRYYLIRTHKRNLLHLNIRGLAILGVSRFEGLVQSKDLTPRLNWSDQIEVFSRLDPRDREICRQISLGITTREIAAQLKITPRSVESHKQKILEALSLPNTVEMIKLLVRFQEHGIADLGI